MKKPETTPIKPTRQHDITQPLTPVRDRDLRRVVGGSGIIGDGIGTTPT